jgi:hypothetical protein
MHIGGGAVFIAVVIYILLTIVEDFPSSRHLHLLRNVAKDVAHEIDTFEGRGMVEDRQSARKVMTTSREACSGAPASQVPAR